MSELDLSVIIITLNEERDLPRCLASLPAGAEVVVVDSGSTDRTVKIANDYGAKVSVSPFVNYADQKNKALSLATRTWVFSIDADEVVSADLAAYLRSPFARSVPPQVGGYYVDRRLFFMGRRMLFGNGVISPLRLFRREGAKFQHEIHENVVFSYPCKVKRLKRKELFHYSYVDLNDFIHKLNLYTDILAKVRYREGKKVPPLITWRPFWSFFYQYFIRLGFLNGYPGYCQAILSAPETLVKYLKLSELYRQRSSVP